MEAEPSLIFLHHNDRKGVLRGQSRIEVILPKVFVVIGKKELFPDGSGWGESGYRLLLTYEDQTVRTICYTNDTLERDESWNWDNARRKEPRLSRPGYGWRRVDE